MGDCDGIYADQPVIGPPPLSSLGFVLMGARQLQWTRGNSEPFPRGYLIGSAYFSILQGCQVGNRPESPEMSREHELALCEELGLGGIAFSGKFIFWEYWFPGVGSYCLGKDSSLKPPSMSGAPGTPAMKQSLPAGSLPTGELE